MNFTFADISSVYLKMMRKDISAGNSVPDIKSTGAETGMSEKPVFEEKLSKTLEKDTSGSEKTFSTPEEKIEKIVESLSETMEEDSGTGFAIALKTLFLMLSNGDLENIELGDQGLDALKKLLVEAGFDEEEIDQLISELVEGSEDGSFSLDLFFAGLSELSAESEKQDNEVSDAYIETSYLPALESVLLSLGIDNEKVQDILSRANKGDQGISLDIVLQELKAIRKTAFYNQTSYQTKDNDPLIGQVLQQLGLVSEGAEITSFNLDDMIASLEQLRKTKMAQQPVLSAATEQSSSKNNVQDMLNTLFKGLEIKNASAEKSLFEFSEFQVKEPLKAGLISLSGEVLTEKIKPEAGTSLKEMFKEMAALFEKEKQIHSDGSRVTDKEAASVLKQVKTGSMKGQDTLQTAVSDLKTTENQSSVSNLKTTTTTRQLPEFVTKQVSRSIVRAVNQGESTLRIQLKPAELGRMLMTIENNGNALKVSIVTENQAAKEILASNTTELKSLLSNSGVNLERFEVDMSSDFRQSMADTKNQAGNFSGRQRNADGQEADGKNSVNKEDVGQLPGVLNPDGSLHYVA